ncbi:ribokinase [Peterkaempfera griseoplana]|uniref:ribokinase n=1 Tax=Peterkaempfera griseoplana TaxID=66896 RepID=UPI0006E3CA2B|nr:ribokinase [Peterkaempfera griseoplana]
MDPYDLVVVGSANADLVVAVERRPEAGETVLGSDLVTHPGGKGANQAVAAARLGASAALLARIGADGHGDLLADSLRGAGVDTSGVLVDGTPTGVALITVDPSGNNSIVVSPGANARLTPQDVRQAEPLLAAARVVSLQLEIPLDTAAEAVRTAVRNGTRVVLNPSPPAPLPADVLAACDPLVVNEHEARHLLRAAEHGAADAASPHEWAAGLLAAGPRSVVVTLGERGALVADADGVLPVPTPRVEAVDTTGAGDAFTAALAWRLARGEALADAARFAVRVGALAVTRPGAQESYPTLEEVDQGRRAEPGTEAVER